MNSQDRRSVNGSGGLEGICPQSLVQVRAAKTGLPSE